MILTQSMRFSPEEYRGKRISISVEEGYIVDVNVEDHDPADAAPFGDLIAAGVNGQASGEVDQIGYAIAHAAYGDSDRQSVYAVAFGDDVRSSFAGDRTFVVAFGPSGVEGRYEDGYTFSVVVDFDDDSYDDDEDDED